MTTPDDDPRYRDIAAERGARAAACVDHHLADLKHLMSAQGVGYRMVEGSAVAAESFEVQMIETPDGAR